MRQDDRVLFDRALHRARVSAYASGEFVGQESFMTAGEIRAVASQVGIGRATAVAVARERAGDLPCRFAIAHVPPLPAGTFDVVLLLETMLVFEAKDALMQEVAA